MAMFVLLIVCIQSGKAGDHTLRDGEAELEAVVGQLLHDRREREAEEEGPDPRPGEPSSPLRAQAAAAAAVPRSELQPGPFHSRP